MQGQAFHHVWLAWWAEIFRLISAIAGKPESPSASAVQLKPRSRGAQGSRTCGSQPGWAQPALGVGTAPGVSRAGVPHQGRSVLKRSAIPKSKTGTGETAPPHGSRWQWPHSQQLQGYSALKCCWTLMTIVETQTSGKCCSTDTALSFG